MERGKGVNEFREGLSKLLNDLKERTGARFILTSPLAQEAFPAPYPDPAEHNRELARYGDIVRDIAKENEAPFIDLFRLVRAKKGEFLTTNSIHLSPEGYKVAASAIVGAFERKAPNFKKAEHLRQAVLAKNEQHFNQWRPQNTTYLFGFRKHEQGRNAVEVEQIEPYLKRFDTRIRHLVVAVNNGQIIEPDQIAEPGVGFNPQGSKYVAKPEKEIQTFKLPEDLEVSLFAAEPMVVNPTCMNWDQKGRLWVACAPLYPHVKPGHRATDRIVVLEDTDGDGKADVSTTFAEDLLIPTAVLPGDGGVYVGNSTELLHLKDTDGDGKADQKRVVLSGFGTEDTHHILHTPQWGQDGLMYINQSIYIHSHVETPWGVSRLMAGGIWQFDPRKDKLKVVSRGLVNTWGHQMDHWGQSFATDGAGGEGINYIFPGVAARTAYGTRHLLPGMNPGQPKLCGLEVISGTHFPQHYQGLLVANDFRGHRTGSFRLTDNGSGYASKRDVDFMGTGHHGTDRLGKGGGFRPIDLKMGPDGALYVADWSNIIIQHGEVDFRDDRRDHEHGRIWRITAKDRKLVETPQIHKASIASLLDNLESSERWTVQMSKRELIERGPKVLTEVSAWEAKLAGDNAERLRLEALWLFKALGQPNNRLLNQCLGAKDGRVRAAAVRVLHHWIGETSGVAEKLNRAVADEHPRVRLEALHALRELKNVAAAETSIRVLDKEMDKVLEYALILNLRELESHWAGKTMLSENMDHLAFAIRATGNTSALKPLLTAFDEGTIPATSRTAVFSLIARHGDAAQAGKLLRVAAGPNLSVDDRVSLLNAIASADRKTRPSGDLSSVLGMIKNEDARIARAAMKLAGNLRLGQAIDTLIGIAENPRHALSQDAIRAIGGIGGKPATDFLTKMMSSSVEGNQRISAASQLVGINSAAAARLTPRLLRELPEGSNPGPLFDAFYRDKHGPTHLNNALRGQRIPAPMATIAIQQANISGRKLTEHIQVITAAGELKPMKQQLNAEEMNALVERVQLEGIPETGELIYRRSNLACLNCHAIGGAGPKIGPDLMSIGASAPIDYLVESLLNPNAKIKEGYHMTVATMRNGQSFAGSQVSESGDQLVIRDPAGLIHNLDKRQVANKFVSPTSMMPPGLTASLRPDEFVHLVSFLSKLGKDEKFSGPKGQVLKAFEVALPSEKLKDYWKNRKKENFMADSDQFGWQTATSLVDGRILMDESTFPAMKFLRFRVDSTGTGGAAIKVSTEGQVEGWADGERLDFRKGLAEYQTKRAYAPSFLL